MRVQERVRRRGSRGKGFGLSWMIFAVAGLALVTFAEREAECLEVTLVMNTPDKHQVTGTLKEGKEDGTITLIGVYGEETYKKGQYLTATCPEPAEQVLAKQSYMRGEYARALELYGNVHRRYRDLGWGAASLEGMGKCRWGMWRRQWKAIRDFWTNIRAIRGAEGPSSLWPRCVWREKSWAGRWSYTKRLSRNRMTSCRRCPSAIWEIFII